MTEDNPLPDDAIAKLEDGHRAIRAEVIAMRQDLRDVVEAQGQWLPLKQAHRRLGVSIETLRTTITEAVAADSTTIFEGVRFRNTGLGKQKPRYCVWSPDLGRARTAG